jgi:hypothetical protein
VAAPQEQKAGGKFEKSVGETKKEFFHSKSLTKSLIKPFSEIFDCVSTMSSNCFTPFSVLALKNSNTNKQF